VGTLVTAAAWVAVMARRGHERRSAPGAVVAHPALLALLGVCMIAAPLVPVVAFDYWLHSRMLYASAPGLGVLLGAILAALGHRGSKPSEDRRAARAVVAGLGAGGLIFLAVAMVGFQAGMQRRHRLDMEALAQLRRLVGDAPRESVLVPVRIALPEGPAWGRRFDSFFCSVFNSWWSSRWALRHAFERSDLSATETRWSLVGWRAPGQDGVAAGARRISWDQLVPFELDEHNRAWLITSVSYAGPSGAIIRVELPLTAPLAARGVVPAREYQFPAGR
jgi:hypothetical protein